MAKVDGSGVTSTVAGGLLILAGVKGYSLLTLINNLVTGKPPLSGVDVSAPLTNASAEDKSITPIVQGSAVKVTGGIIAKQYGWEGAEWDALDKLWTQESSWNTHAQNPSSGAYGIPQALPYTKMPKAAWPESAGGSSDAEAQIRWGLDYIKGRYGSPTMAWAHEVANGWY